MPSMIESIHVRNQSLSPTEATILLHVAVSPSAAPAELRGRLIGPRCRYASTVEVAYPLRPANKQILRGVIPEPCFWDPQSPFLYQGHLELWSDGELLEQAHFWHGLGVVNLTAAGCRVNGRPLSIQGRVVEGCTEADLFQWHTDGCNTLLTDLANASLWDVGDRLGFLTLGRISSIDQREALRKVAMRDHASALGWVVGAELVHQDDWNDRAWEMHELLTETRPDLSRSGLFLGIELTRTPHTAVPEWASFLVCPEALLPACGAIPLPKLAVGVNQEFHFVPG